MDNEAFQEATPLFRAIETSDTASVRKLLQTGADPNECYGEDEDTALLVASIKGNAEIVALLLAAGADVNHGDMSGYTPLMAATCAHSLPIVEQLLEAGANVNNKCARSRATALHDAASGNHREIAAALLRAGANPNAAENADGNTPLMNAVQTLSPDITDLLLQAGAKADFRSSRGDTALDLIRNELLYIWEPDKKARARHVEELLQQHIQASSPDTN